MGSVKKISNFQSFKEFPFYHFGWEEKELAAYRHRYQAEYFGEKFDARFEIVDDLEETSYAIFRSAEDNDFQLANSNDFLLLKDQNRVLVNAGGALYRFLINEKICLEEQPYLNNIIGSRYFHSMSSLQHEIMVVADAEGTAALTWDAMLWKHKFEFAYSGDIHLVEIRDNRLIVFDDSPKGASHLEFDLHTGKAM